MEQRAETILVINQNLSMLYDVNYGKIDEAGFFEGICCSATGGKIYSGTIFCARQLSGSASPDVTSQRVIYASTALHPCLTCFSLERKVRKLAYIGKSRSESNL